MAMVLKLIYRFKVIGIKIPASFSAENNSPILKSYEMQGTHGTQNNLERNNNVKKDSHFSILKLTTKL